MACLALWSGEGACVCLGGRSNQLIQLAVRPAVQCAPHSAQRLLAIRRVSHSPHNPQALGAHSPIAIENDGITALQIGGRLGVPSPENKEQIHCGTHSGMRSGFATHTTHDMR